MLRMWRREKEKREGEEAKKSCGGGRGDKKESARGGSLTPFACLTFLLTFFCETSNYVPTLAWEKPR